MNCLELKKYYIKNKDEFIGESGHEKLLIGLSQYVTNIEESDKKIVCIDVGCCVGDYIPNLHQICKEDNMEMLCFEPNPVNILKL
jgi:hypothetical protein